MTVHIKQYRVSLGPLWPFRVGPLPLFSSYLQPVVVPLSKWVGPPRSPIHGVGPPRYTSHNLWLCGIYATIDPLWT